MRRALVTGATGRVGSVLTRALLEDGWGVLAVTRDTQRARETLGEASALDILEADLESPRGVEELLGAVDEAAGQPELLVNNARNRDHLAVERPELPARDGWWGEYLLNVVVPWELTIGLARASGSRLQSVVNVGSMYGGVVQPPDLYEDPMRQTTPQYGTAKAALVHATRELAVRLGPSGIRVNCVAYGGVHGRVDPAFEARYAERTPLGGMLDDDDLPGVVRFLASEGARSITGQCIGVDGGWGAR